MGFLAELGLDRDPLLLPLLRRGGMKGARTHEQGSNGEQGLAESAEESHGTPCCHCLYGGPCI